MAASQSEAACFLGSSAHIPPVTDSSCLSSEHEDRAWQSSLCLEKVAWGFHEMLVLGLARKRLQVNDWERKGCISLLFILCAEEN